MAFLLSYLFLSMKQINNVAKMKKSLYQRHEKESLLYQRQEKRVIYLSIGGRRRRVFYLSIGVRKGGSSYRRQEKERKI